MKRLDHRSVSHQQSHGVTFPLPKLTSIMADPVADKSGFLCLYMSSHPDTLVAYVKHFGKVDGNIASAKMLSIDSKVRVTTPSPPAGTSVRPSLPSAGEMGRWNEGLSRFRHINALLYRGWTWSTRPKIRLPSRRSFASRSTPR